MVCRELSVELKLLMPKIKLFKDCLWRDGSHNINQAEVRARRNSNSIHGHLRREGSSSQARRTRNGTQLFNFLFQGFDWEGLDSRSLDPPITPKVFFYQFLFLKYLTPLVVSGARTVGHVELWQVSSWRGRSWRRSVGLGQRVLKIWDQRFSTFPNHKAASNILGLSKFPQLSGRPLFYEKRIFSTDILSPWLFSENQCLLYTWTVDISVDKQMCTFDQIALHLRQDVIAQNRMRRPSCHLLRKAASIWKPRTGCVLCTCRERFMNASVLIPRSEVTKLCNGNPELTINVQLFFRNVFVDIFCLDSKCLSSFHNSNIRFARLKFQCLNWIMHNVLFLMHNPMYYSYSCLEILHLYLTGLYLVVHFGGL